MTKKMFITAKDMQEIWYLLDFNKINLTNADIYINDREGLNSVSLDVTFNVQKAHFCNFINSRKKYINQY